MSMPPTLPNRAHSLITVKSVDEAARKIEGIASTPTVDRHGDVVEPRGAQFTLPMPLLLHHQMDQPIGEVTTARATNDGIAFAATIARTAEPGRVKDRLDEAWQSLRLGLIKGVSIGFKPIEYSLTETGMRFSRWDWVELSLVTIPANSEATVQLVKRADAELLAAMGRRGAVANKGTGDMKRDRIISNSQAEACVIDALAQICAKFESQVERDIDRLRSDMKRELEVMKAECRAAIAEIRVAACQALIETRGDAQAVEKLRAVGGGRDW